jgi:hypothetical protein
MGKFFQRLKDKIMGGFIVKFLAKIIEGFKTKNPKSWAVLFAVASGLQFGFDGFLEGLLGGIGLAIDLPIGFLSLDFILNYFNITLGDTVTDWIMWVLVGITGSKAAAFLPEKDRDKALEKQAKEVERLKAKEAKRAERLAKK